jgi:hypothetical protein
MELSEIVAHNFRQLGCQYRLQGGDSLNTLESINQNGIGSILILDVMMQRQSFMQRLFTNVPDNLEYYFKNSDAILVKQLL